MEQWVAERHLQFDPLVAENLDQKTMAKLASVRFFADAKGGF